MFNSFFGELSFFNIHAIILSCVTMKLGLIRVIINCYYVFERVTLLTSSHTSHFYSLVFFRRLPLITVSGQWMPVTQSLLVSKESMKVVIVCCNQPLGVQVSYKGSVFNENTCIYI